MLTPDPREHASIASIVLDEPVWDAGDVETELLSPPEPPASATVAVYRARGSVPRPWSAVCKVLAGDRRGHPNWPASDDMAHWYWWRREEMAYTTGLLGQLAGGLRAPRFLNAFGRPGGRVALWIEDVTAPRASTWSVGRYGESARHLGRAQLEMTSVLADDGWLVRDFLPGYLARHDGIVAGSTADWEVLVAARALLSDRARLLAVVDEFPSTLCHHDFHALNLFGDEGGPSIAIDWAFVGIGPLPVDAGPFAADAVLDYGAPVASLPGLHEAVETGFVAGLRDGGWAGDDVRLRLAMRVAAGLKFAWVAAAAADPSPETLTRWEAHYGRDGAEVRDDRRWVAEWLVGMAADAAARL